MFDYVEIRNTARERIGIIDTAKSIIWHSIWFGVGDFEIYAEATPNHVQILQEGYYVTRPDNDEIGKIEYVEYTTYLTDGKMIVAKGRFAKSILDRRLIYNLVGTKNKATVIDGKVENAARALVANNAISCTFDTGRNFTILELGAISDIPLIIVDENGNPASKQVSYENLLEYTDKLLEEYGLSSKIILNDETKKLQYIVKQGIDRGQGNAAGLDPIVFSKDFDNLENSDYIYNSQGHKNMALIGGEGEGVDRFYVALNTNLTGLDRRELFVDGRTISKQYDDNGTTRQYTDAQYTQMLKTKGKEELAQKPIVESFTGNINITEGNYIYNRDFALGDIVTVQENSINKYINVRITEVTEVLDENGYEINAVYK